MGWKIRGNAIVPLALLLLIAALALRAELVQPPPVRDQTGVGQFDTQRALARLQRILGDERPHPVDSDANDEVRERLITEMRAIGLEPEVSDTFACNSFLPRRSISCARVRNVRATIGPEDGEHLLLVSHYDSTPAGPGAADAGIGVATILEVADLLRQRQLSRPVTLLITDGEEAGLLGARAFLDSDPLAERVEALINLEARGVTGPAVMFETNKPNAVAIEYFNRNPRNPVANSLATDFYKLLPNSTDVAVFEERDWTILNFGIIGNENRYHSPGDDLATLDRRSLQHMGDQTLALAATIADGPPTTARGERIFINLPFHDRMIVLPVHAGYIILAILLLLFVYLSWRMRRGVLPAAGLVLGTIAAATAITYAMQWLTGLFRTGDYWRGWPFVTGTAMVLTTLAVSTAAVFLIGWSLETDRLRVAFWTIFVLTGALVGMFIPGAMILFLIPPAAAGLGTLAERVHPGSGMAGGSLAVVTAYMSFGPVLHLIEELLHQRSAWMFVSIASIIILAAMIEIKAFATDPSRRWTAAALGGAALIAWAAVLLVPAYSDARRQLFIVEYVRDEKANAPRWMIANDGAPLPAVYEEFGDFDRVEVPYSGRKRWAVEAPAAAVRPPALERLGERDGAEGRVISFRLHSGGTDSIVLKAAAEAMPIAVSANGYRAEFGRKGDEDDPWYFRCHGRSCDGLRLELLLPKDAPPAEWALIGFRSGLPPAGERLLELRPPKAQPQYGTDSTITVDWFRL
jgi:hypothetical protein